MPDPEAQPPDAPLAPPAPEPPTPAAHVAASDAAPAQPPDEPAASAPAPDAAPALTPEGTFSPAPARTYLPFAAYPGAAGPRPAPTWTKAYEHPTARRIVSTGLQLAVDANRDIRRASIYVGLLALGAFGPMVLLLLLGVAHLLSDPAIAATFAHDPSAIFYEQPELAGPLILVYFLLIAGGIVLIGISVDAQAMAISILGGRASERPIRLWEAIVRARQVFWQLLAADLMLGVVTTVVMIVITVMFARPFESNAGLSFIASAIGTLVVMPFVFASTGIVLGGVTATEALRRSMALFRARPRISLVVTLFTLVTASIQSFAINAGADAALRVGGVLHLGLDQGLLPLVLTVVIVLAFIVAFGSLTFTIAAIVAAPQVTGFLGLTYYSGGLDKARSVDGVRPRRFRWVSAPMALAMLGILIVAGLQLPTATGFAIHPTDPIVSILRTTPGIEGDTVLPVGVSNTVADPTGDGVGLQRASIDVVRAGYAFLPEVPDWFLHAMFDCAASNVACGNPGTGSAVYKGGAFLFHQQMAGPLGVVGDTERGQWGPIVAVVGHLAAPVSPDEALGGATHAIVTRMEGGKSTIHMCVAADGSFDDAFTNARSTWIGNDLLTLVPADSELRTDVVRWDVTASILFSGGGYDALRPTNMTPLRTAADDPFKIILFDPFGLESFVP